MDTAKELARWERLEAGLIGYVISFYVFLGGENSGAGKEGMSVGWLFRGLLVSEILQPAATNPTPQPCAYS